MRNGVSSDVRPVHKYLNKNFSKVGSVLYREPSSPANCTPFNRNDETNFESSKERRKASVCCIIVCRYASICEGCVPLTMVVDTPCHCLNHPLGRKETRENSCYTRVTLVLYIYISSYPSSVFLAFPPRTISSSPLLCGQAFEIEGSSPFVVALRLFV